MPHPCLLVRPGIKMKVSGIVAYQEKEARWPWAARPLGRDQSSIHFTPIRLGPPSPSLSFRSSGTVDRSPAVTSSAIAAAVRALAASGVLLYSMNERSFV